MNLEEYQLSAKTLYAVLTEKNVQFLYHANTVLTSLTYINKKALLSRYQVELDGLKQSPQKSDIEDKKYDVWDHVFLDGADLHHTYSRANNYGPVLFRLKLNLLVSPLVQYVYVTKQNPWYWNDKTPMEERYYKSIDEIKADYLTGKKLDSQIMFTIRNPNYEIKLNKYLHSIIIDEPTLIINSTLENKQTLGEYIRKVITDAMSQNGLGHIPILKRHDDGHGWCKCLFNYNLLSLRNLTELKRRFSMKPIV